MQARIRDRRAGVLAQAQHDGVLAGIDLVKTAHHPDAHQQHHHPADDQFVDGGGVDSYFVWKISHDSKRPSLLEAIAGGEFIRSCGQKSAKLPSR